MPTDVRPAGGCQPPSASGPGDDPAGSVGGAAGPWPCCEHCLFCVEHEPFHGEPCEECQ